jgi:hypothetical protein
MRAVIPAIFATLMATVTAQSGEVEQKEAQAIITGQIEAFKSGQDAAAYSYASPFIKGIFPDISVFMGMVKQGYPQVYNPKSYDFGRAKEPTAGKVVQEVLITGPDGKPWTALYDMVRQADGTWKINGVQILPGDDSSA